MDAIVCLYDVGRSIYAASSPTHAVLMSILCIAVVRVDPCSTIYDYVYVMYMYYCSTLYARSCM